ncbi:MAG: VOC family protein [Actinomycetota bacterium]
MTSRFSELAIDCHDTKRVAEFWCAVLGYEITDMDGDLIEIGAGKLEAGPLRAGPVPPSIVFARVPESKTIKNRIHIDVNPIDATQEEEVARLEALGAKRIDIGQGDVHWVVMADPEGNEFCVLRSLAP